MPNIPANLPGISHAEGPKAQFQNFEKTRKLPGEAGYILLVK